MAYSDDELLKALREFAAEKGRPPTAPEANEQEGFPSATTFVNHFGSWNAALAEADCETRHRHRSDDELLADLRELVDTLGKHPSCNGIDDHEEMASAATYQRRFGSLNAAIAKAGLSTFSRASYSDADLVEALRRLADELGRPPRADELDTRSDAPSQMAFIDRYGSWNAALVAANLDTQGYSDEELLETLRELADDLGRLPRIRDLRGDESLPSIRPFVDHFGAWTNAVNVALDDRESDTEATVPDSMVADGKGTNE